MKPSIVRAIVLITSLLVVSHGNVAATIVQPVRQLAQICLDLVDDYGLGMQASPNESKYESVKLMKSSSSQCSSLMLVSHSGAGSPAPSLAMPPRAGDASPPTSKMPPAGTDASPLPTTNQPGTNKLPTLPIMSNVCCPATGGSIPGVPALEYLGTGYHILRETLVEPLHPNWTLDFAMVLSSWFKIKASWLLAKNLQCLLEWSTNSQQCASSCQTLQMFPWHLNINASSSRKQWPVAWPVPASALVAALVPSPLRPQLESIFLFKEWMGWLFHNGPLTNTDYHFWYLGILHGVWGLFPNILWPWASGCIPPCFGHPTHSFQQK